jgi:transmembrane sensor
MTRIEFDEILQRYHHDQCTPEEKALVETWLNAIEKDAPSMPGGKEHFALAEKMWAGVEQKVERRRFTAWPLVRVAASVALLALSLFMVFTYVKQKGSQHVAGGNERMITYTNTGMETQKISFSDGSFVLVHPNSEVRYPEVFVGAIRAVHLSGEAFFEVAKDAKHPFMVYANEVTTKVLGTSFSIKAYKGQKEIVVAVKTGRVSVLSPGASSETIESEVILTPNQQVTYNRTEGKVTKHLVENPDIIVPNPSRELLYRDEPVIHVFEALEKMYGVDIRYDERALAGCTITTEMTDEKLFDRMDLICHVLGGHYTVEDAVIIVDAKGCTK